MDTNVYAVINPEGELHFRTGVPYAMWRETDPHHGAHSGFTVTEAQQWTPGLRGYVGDVSALFPGEVPAQPRRPAVRLRTRRAVGHRAVREPDAVRAVLVVLR